MELQALLERTRAELRDVRVRLELREAAGSTGNDELTKQHAATQAQLTGVIAELRDRLRFSELQLAASREEGETLARQIHELRSSLSDSQSRVAELSAARIQASHSARGEEAALEKLRQEMSRNMELTRSLDHMKHEHERLLSRKSDELQRVSERAQKAGHDLADARARVDAQNKTNQDLTDQLVSLKEQLKSAHLARRSDVHAMAALHQLQLDNQRLVKLLASTAEYEQFVAYSDESGGLSYLPPNPVTGVDGARVRLPKSACSGRDRKVYGPGREVEFWVPADAYALMSDFRHHHVPAVPMSHFHELLLKLNRIWKKRETRSIERMRAAHSHKVSELRRRLAQQTPYDEVVLSSELERLRRDLKAARAAVVGGGRRLNPSERDLLDSTLMSVEDHQRQLRLAAHANDELRIELMDKMHEVHGAFGSGAKAAADVAASEADGLSARMYDLMRDYRTKLMGLSRADSDLLTNVLRLQSRFFDAIERQLSSTKQKLARIHEIPRPAAIDETDFSGLLGGSACSQHPRHSGVTFREDTASAVTHASSRDAATKFRGKVDAFESQSDSECEYFES